MNSDIFVAEIAIDPQHQGHSKDLGKSHQSRLHPVGVCNLITGITSHSNDIEDFDCFGPSANDGQRRVRGDAEEPCRKLGIRPELGEVSPCCEEGVLQCIFGIGSIAGDPQTHRPHGTAVGSYQFHERTLVPGTRSANECRFVVDPNHAGHLPTTRPVRRPGTRKTRHRHDRGSVPVAPFIELAGNLL